jgi:hypothetical protein
VADLDYVADLGLITIQPSVKIANRLYQEVIPRELTWRKQNRIPNQETAWYVRPDRRLDMDKLLDAFQQFYREDADRWLGSTQYVEAGPQLLMQAFLQRIVNGGGRITRENALGRKRTDLLVEWPLDEAQGLHGPVQRIVIELKLLRSGALDALIARALPQAADYADRVGADETHLVVFDRTGRTTWDERVWHTTKTADGRTIGVWGA